MVFIAFTFEAAGGLAAAPGLHHRVFWDVSWIQTIQKVMLVLLHVLICRVLRAVATTQQIRRYILAFHMHLPPIPASLGICPTQKGDALWWL